MNNWTKSLLIGFGAAAVVYLFSDHLVGKIKPTKYYSVFIKLQMTSPDFPANASKALLVLEKRMQEAGYEYKLDIPKEKMREQEFMVDISLKNIEDTLLCAEIIGTDGRLSITEMYTLPEMNSFLQVLSDSITRRKLGQQPPEKMDTLNELVVAETITRKEKENDLATLLTMTFGEAALGSVAISDTAELGQIIRAIAPENLPAKAFFCYGPVPAASTPNKSDEKRLPLYVLKIDSFEKPELGNNDILSASQESGVTAPMVTFQFTARGTSIWEYMTRRNVNRPLAMVVGGKVISAPTVYEPIMGGMVNISGNFTESEAKAFALLISGEPLPAKPAIKEFKVSASGKSKNDQKLTLTAIAFLFSAITSLLIFKTLKST